MSDEDKKTEKFDVNEFQTRGKIYVAVEEKSCAGCAFDMINCPSFSCSASTREDGSDVIFVEKGNRP